MQVSKWGNSLAIRLPATVVEALDLKEGDQINIEVAGTRSFAVGRDNEREEALMRLLARRVDLPAGWKFDRQEANER
jgi:antitoxin MazE